MLHPFLLEISPHQLEVVETLLQVGRFLIIFVVARTIAELMVRLQLPRSWANWWPACSSVCLVCI